MTGGTFTALNKTRPGVYINFASKPKAIGNIGERGITSAALTLSWGEPHTITAINAGDNIKEVLGYDISAGHSLLIREALKRAQTILVYRLNEGTKATATAGGLTMTAKYGGVRGNDLSVVVQENVDNEEQFDIKTYLEGEVVDSQTVSTIANLINTPWINFSGSGVLSTTAGVPLTGGADGTATNQNHVNYLSALELLDFNTVALVSTDSQLKALYTAFIKRLRENEGKKVQGIVENYTTADYEGIISVKNGVILSDGTTLNPSQATVWVAGATAGSAANESLTHSAYDDAVDVTPRYTNSQIIEALKAGEFLFTASGSQAFVEQDINSLVSFTPDKGRAFAKNRVIRVLDGFANDISKTFHAFYLGKVNNNEDGRGLFKSEIISYLTRQQGIQAIQNFDAQTDISVTAGDDGDSIVVEVQMQPVDAVEKIYMKVQVN